MDTTFIGANNSLPTSPQLSLKFVRFSYGGFELEEVEFGLHELRIRREFDDDGNEVVKRSRESVLPRFGEIHRKRRIL